MCDSLLQMRSDVRHLGYCNQRSLIPRIHSAPVTCSTRKTECSSQSIKIGIDLSIDKKIGKSELIDFDCIDQSVEIDDISFIDLTRFLPISSIHIGRNFCSSVHQKNKTEFMQTVNLLTIEWQLRVEESNSYRYVVYQTLSLIKKCF